MCGLALRLVIALVIGALCARPAAAHTVVWELGGTIEEIELATVPGHFDEADRAALLADWRIAVGAAWSGRMSFDASARPISPSPDPNSVSFRDPRTHLEFSFGALDTATPPWDVSGMAALNRAPPIADSLLFTALVAGSGLAEVQSFLASLDLVAAYGQVFTPGELPADPPDVQALIPRASDPHSALTGTRFTYLGFVHLPGVGNPLPFTLDGRITRLERVPEPGLLPLLPPLIALSVRRAQRSRWARRSMSAGVSGRRRSPRARRQRVPGASHASRRRRVSSIFMLANRPATRSLPPAGRARRGRSSIFTVPCVLSIARSDCKDGRGLGSERARCYAHSPTWASCCCTSARSGTAARASLPAANWAAMKPCSAARASWYTRPQPPARLKQRPTR